MYLGHLSAALTARGMTARHDSPRDAPSPPPYALLLFASFGPDWIETTEMLLGVRDTPMWSHSIPAVAVGIAGTGLLALWKTGSRRSAQIVSAVYLSHILFDYLTGIKPTWPGGPKIGLHLYAHPVIDFLLESTVLVAATLFYRRSLPVSARQSRSFLALPLTLIAVQLLLLLLPLLGIQALFDWKYAR